MKNENVCFTSLCELASFAAVITPLAQAVITKTVGVIHGAVLRLLAVMAIRFKHVCASCLLPVEASRMESASRCKVASDQFISLFLTSQDAL